MGLLKVHVALRFTVKWFVTVNCAYLHKKKKKKKQCKCNCAQTHTHGIVLCSDSPSPGEAAGEPSGDEPNNSHVNVQSAYTEWTWGGVGKLEYAQSAALLT